MAYGNDIVE